MEDMNNFEAKLDQCIKKVNLHGGQIEQTIVTKMGEVQELYRSEFAKLREEVYNENEAIVNLIKEVNELYGIADDEEK